jgi:hypothetical protein
MIFINNDFAPTEQAQITCPCCDGNQLEYLTTSGEVICKSDWCELPQDERETRMCELCDGRGHVDADIYAEQF